MREQLTDEMILQSLSKSPIPMLIIGIVILIIGIIICIAIKKNTRYEHDRRYLYAAGPFLFFGVFLIYLGATRLLQEKLTMDSFVVKKCEIVDMYSKKKNERDTNADSKDYYIVCSGYDGEIKVTYQQYYNEYEVGDFMYLVVKADDENYLYHVYWEDEYEYVGSNLTE